MVRAVVMALALVWQGNPALFGAARSGNAYRGRHRGTHVLRNVPDSLMTTSARRVHHVRAHLERPPMKTDNQRQTETTETIDTAKLEDVTGGCGACPGGVCQLQGQNNLWADAQQRSALRS
jgi:hypothetical protein